MKKAAFVFLPSVILSLSSTYGAESNVQLYGAEILEIQRQEEYQAIESFVGADSNERSNFFYRQRLGNGLFSFGLGTTKIRKGKARADDESSNVLEFIADDRLVVYTVGKEPLLPLDLCKLSEFCAENAVALQELVDTKCRYGKWNARRVSCKYTTKYEYCVDRRTSKNWCINKGDFVCSTNWDVIGPPTRCP